MDHHMQLLLCYLEEDNIQRAYFRAIPFMTQHGSIQAESLETWPDLGSLRIIPDRNEQIHFRDRMREIGPFCVIDVKEFGADAHKIRTNKNYAPDRGELNRYIVFSDAIRPIAGAVFCQVLEGGPDRAAELAAQSRTPYFYLKSADAWFGPIDVKAPDAPEPAAEPAAQCAYTAPDGRIYAFAAPAEEASGSEEAEPVLPIGERLEILDSSLSHDETVAKLNVQPEETANRLAEAAPADETGAQPSDQAGTPLAHTADAAPVSRPRNLLQAVVSRQLSAGKGVPRENSEDLFSNACRALAQAWQNPNNTQKLTDSILSLPGMRAQLVGRMAAQHPSPLAEAMQRQLHELEAERLSALVQLDRANADLSAAVADAAARQQRDAGQALADLQVRADELRKTVDTIREEGNRLTAYRDSLSEEIRQLRTGVLPEALSAALAAAGPEVLNGMPAVSRISGAPLPAGEIISRINQALQDSGLNAGRNTAASILALLTVCKRLTIVCPTPAPLATLLRNIMAALGAEGCLRTVSGHAQRPMFHAEMPDPVPAVTIEAGCEAAEPQECCLTISLQSAMNEALSVPAWRCATWPVLSVGPLPVIPLTESRGTPVSVSQLKPADADAHSAILSPLLSAAAPISGEALMEMRQYIALCSEWMEGGLPSAVDHAVLLWLAPQMRQRQDQAKYRLLLSEYPLSLQAVCG